MRASFLFASSIALALLSPGAQAQSGIKYQVTMKMEMMGMAMPMPPQDVCAPAGGSERMIPMQDDCQVSNYRSSGSRSTWDFRCTGDQPMSGTGEFTQQGADGYQGRITGTVEGEPMTMSFEGRKVGVCDAGELSAAMRQGQEQIGETCRNMVADKPSTLLLLHQQFIGANAMCAAHRNTFCAKVTQASGDLDTILRQQQTEARSGGALGTSQWQTYQACGLTRATVVGRACDKAQATAHYAFIGALCPDRIARACTSVDPNRHPDFVIDHCGARAAQIAGTCTSRAFTASVAAPNAAFCNRYSARRLQQRN